MQRPKAFLPRVYPVENVRRVRLKHCDPRGLCQTSDDSLFCIYENINMSKGDRIDVTVDNYWSMVP